MQVYFIRKSLETTPTPQLDETWLSITMMTIISLAEEYDIKMDLVAEEQSSLRAHTQSGGPETYKLRMTRPPTQIQARGRINCKMNMNCIFRMSEIVIASLAPKPSISKPLPSIFK